jgi:hypothetical protein
LPLTFAIELLQPLAEGNPKAFATVKERAGWILAWWCENSLLKKEEEEEEEEKEEKEEEEENWFQVSVKAIKIQ